MNEIIKAMREAGFNYYGVRTGKKQNIGDYLEPSHDWDLENDCESEDYLPGTCATIISAHRLDSDEDLEEAIAEAIKTNNRYCGDSQYIIGSNSMEYGFDPQEAIISDAKVIYIIR